MFFKSSWQDVDMQVIRTIVAAVLLSAVLAPVRASAQDGAAQDHAKKVLESLRQSKFDDVAAEFNAQVAAAISANQLADLWASVKSQMGEFKSVIDQKSMDAQGLKIVVSGCQFDAAVVEIMVAFDAANKIAGLQLRPRSPAAASAPDPAPAPAPSAPPPPPPSR